MQWNPSNAIGVQPSEARRPSGQLAEVVREQQPSQRQNMAGRRDGFHRANTLAQTRAWDVPDTHLTPETRGQSRPESERSFCQIGCVKGGGQTRPGLIGGSDRKASSALIRAAARGRRRQVRPELRTDYPVLQERGKRILPTTSRHHSSQIGATIVALAYHATPHTPHPTPLIGVVVWHVEGLDLPHRHIATPASVARSGSVAEFTSGRICWSVEEGPVVPRHIWAAFDGNEPVGQQLPQQGLHFGSTGSL